MMLQKALRRLARAGLLITLFGLVGIAAAQESSDDSTAEQPAPAPKTTATTKDTFTPSEEVSEDLSVSFPVDI